MSFFSLFIISYLRVVVVDCVSWVVVLISESIVYPLVAQFMNSHAVLFCTSSAFAPISAMMNIHRFICPPFPTYWTYITLKHFYVMLPSCLNSGLLESSTLLHHPPPWLPLWFCTRIWLHTLSKLLECYCRQHTKKEVCFYYTTCKDSSHTSTRFLMSLSLKTQILVWIFKLVKFSIIPRGLHSWIPLV